jgi:hypothetical protein
MRPRLLTRSIKALLGVKKPNITFERHPDDYYQHIYVDKPHYEALDFMGKANRMTKMGMYHDLLDRGIRDFLGEKIGEYNRQVIAARKRQQHVRPTKFIYQLRRRAKTKGADISKFI